MESFVKKLINIEEYKKKIKFDVQLMRNNYSSNSNLAENYFHALSEYFLEDIKSLITQLYELAIVKISKNKEQISTQELREHIYNEVKIFFPEYESYISGYNFGLMIQAYSGDLNKDILNPFKERANQTLKDQCDFLDENYCKDLKQNRYNSHILIASIVAAIGGVIVVVFSVLQYLK